MEEFIQLLIEYLSEVIKGCIQLITAIVDIFSSDYSVLEALSR